MQYYPTIKQTFSLLGKFLWITLLLSFPTAGLAILFDTLKFESKLVSSIIFLISYSILFIIIVRIGLKRFRLGNNSDYKFKFGSVRIKIFLISLITFIAGTIVIEPFSASIPMPESIKEYFANLIQPNIFSFLSIAVAAPILEEMLFRGIILEGFLKNYSPQKAIIWSSIIFGIFHLNPWQAVNAFLIALFIGWIYWKTNSLIPGILLHFANNALAFVLTFSVEKEADSLWQLIDDRITYGAIFLVALCVLTFGWWILNKLFEKNSLQESNYSEEGLLT